MSDQQDFEKWQKQIEDLAAIFEMDVISNPRIFEEYKKIVRNNAAVNFPNGGRFHLWVERNHYYALLAAIRRIFFNLGDSREFSFIKIIDGLLASGGGINTGTYPGLIGVTGTGLISAAAASSASQGFFDQNGQLSRPKLTADRAVLMDAKRQLKFINERVLHNQQSPTAHIPSSSDLKQIVKTLGDLLKEYRLFLGGSTIAWSIADYSWVEIFTRPWIDKNV